MFAIYVLNLDRAAHRLRFISERLQSLGLDFTRIVAVDGAKMSDGERANFMKIRPRDMKRTWRPGQIGCFLSHMEAWKRIAEGKETFGLVLEDDMHLSSALASILAGQSWIPTDADIVRLESTGQWLTLDGPSAYVGQRSVRRIKSAAWGAGAYLLKKETAKCLVKSDPASHTPADDFLFNKNGSAMAQTLVTYQVVPALAVQDKFNEENQAAKGFGSDIETDVINQRLRGFAALRRRITSTLRRKTPVEFE